MIKIKPINPISQIRCAIGKRGRLGFTWAAAKKLNLFQRGSITIGRNEEDPKDPCFYMTVYDKRVENAMSINSSGDYYYVNARSVFDSLGYYYEDKYILFNIIELEIFEGGKIYRLEQRSRER